MKQYRMVALLLCVPILFASAEPVRADGMAEKPEYVYSSHMNDGNKIALTFDDGPHPVYTPQILDTLKEYGVHATFFLIGENAERNPELVRRILREGHEIGNHTYLHKNLKEHTSGGIFEEISMAEEAILRIADQRTKLLRPPGGLYDKLVCETARRLDYDIILWTIDTLDWKHPTPEEIIGKVESSVQCGDIILCHDFIGGAPSPTPEAIKKIIPDVLGQGYEFVSVSELIYSK